MGISYEFENQKLKEMIERKAKSLNISVDRLIWNYVNRGLMEDYWTEDSMDKFHSEEYLKKVNDALDVD